MIEHGKEEGSSRRLVAVDIGNSSINIGFFTLAGLSVQKLPSHPLRTPEEYRALMTGFMKLNNIEKNLFPGIISSVVDSHTGALVGALRGFAGGEEKEIFIAGHSMKTGLSLDIRVPEELGVDRLVNAVAAYETVRGPVAVLDFGTASTVTFVDGEANLIGGTIMPGIGLMNDSLEKGTAKLRRVSLEAPESALGKDTDENIRAGLFFGSAGAVERIIAEVEAEKSLRFDVVVTGGFATLAGKFLRRSHRLSPDLPLHGLRILYDKNRTS